MREVMAYQAGKNCSVSPEIIPNWIDAEHNKLQLLAVSHNTKYTRDRSWSRLTPSNERIRELVSHLLDQASNCSGD